MQTKTALFSTLALLSFSAATAPVRAQPPSAEQAVVGQHLADGTSYADVIRLRQQSNAAADGRLLLVFEERGLAGIPLYQSNDDGKSWTLLTHITDGEHGGDPNWQLRWQPNIIETDRRTGPFPAGTLLLAANATRNNERRQVVAEDLQLYASSDLGRTWRYQGSIVQGGGRPEDKDNHGVWEPNLRVLDDGRLVAYYSSEKHKDQGFNQLLAHKVSTDGGRTWGPEVFDVAIPGGVERPGMAVVDRLPDSRYIFSYEDIDGPRNGQVYVKFSRDGLDWGTPSERGTPVQTASGAYPVASPVVKWLPLGGPDGLLVVAAERGSGGGDVGGRDLYWNDDLGRGPWWRLPAPVQKRTGNIHAGWTQGLLLTRDGQLLHITTSSRTADAERAEDNEVLFEQAPVNLHRYEAEDAVRAEGAAVIPDPTASARYKVRVSSDPLGRLSFDVKADRAGPALLTIRYAEIGRPAAPDLTVNGAHIVSTGQPTPDGTWMRITVSAPLLTGRNTIGVSGAPGPIDLDWIEVKGPS